jgi:hypothetical protein
LIYSLNKSSAFFFCNSSVFILISLPLNNVCFNVSFVSLMAQS